MSQTLGVMPGELIVSDDPCLGVPMFSLSEPPEQDPTILLNRRLYLIEARLLQLEEARFHRRCQRGWRWVRRQGVRLSEALRRAWRRLQAP